MCICWSGNKCSTASTVLCPRADHFKNSSRPFAIPFSPSIESLLSSWPQVGHNLGLVGGDATHGTGAQTKGSPRPLSKSALSNSIPRQHSQQGYISTHRYNHGNTRHTVRATGCSVPTYFVFEWGLTTIVSKNYIVDTPAWARHCICFHHTVC